MIESNDVYFVDMSISVFLLLPCLSLGTWLASVLSLLSYTRRLFEWLHTAIEQERHHRQLISVRQAVDQWMLIVSAWFTSRSTRQSIIQLDVDIDYWEWKLESQQSINLDCFHEIACWENDLLIFASICLINRIASNVSFIKDVKDRIIDETLSHS
jgi:hypothetical protein